MNNAQTKHSLLDSYLRFHAERQVEALPARACSPRSEGELQRLVHELEVHQIELEQQNTELRQDRTALETTLEQYTDLYDFAPVGYLTVNRNGTILSANLTAASLLEVDRGRLEGLRFNAFIGRNAHLAWDALLITVFTSGNKESAELSVWTAKNQSLYLQIEAQAKPSRDSCRVGIIDVSMRHRMETKPRSPACRPHEIAWRK